MMSEERKIPNRDCVAPFLAEHDFLYERRLELIRDRSGDLKQRFHKRDHQKISWSSRSCDNHVHTAECCWSIHLGTNPLTCLRAPIYSHPRFQGETYQDNQSTMCPPGVDQTTRFPQRWQLMAPELKHNMPLNHDFGGRKDEDSEAQFMANLFYMLARPLSTPKGSGIPLPQPSQSCGYFDFLSNEIFDMIFSHLDKKRDAVALGLVSIRVWHLVLHNIQANYAAAAPLAGVRLIFQGSYSQDLPPAFIGDGAFFEKFIAPTQSGGFPVRAGFHARAFYWAHAEFPQAVTAQDQMKEYMVAMKTHEEHARIGDTEFKVLEKDLACPGLDRDKHDWILRNLTTREIVCSSKLGGKDEEKSLELVLLKQITWTSMLEDPFRDVLEYRGK